MLSGHGATKPNDMTDWEWLKLRLMDTFGLEEQELLQHLAEYLEADTGDLEYYFSIVLDV